MTAEILKANGINYKGILSKLSKSTDPLTPIQEALTNSLEAIYEKKQNGKITVVIRRSKQLINDIYHFESISIIDNGLGIDERGFERLRDLFDCSKGTMNKGCGRIQYVKFFRETEIESVFVKNESEFFQRTLTLSKDYVDKHNAIIRGQVCHPIDDRPIGTKIIFKTPLEVSDQRYYETIMIDTLRKFPKPPS